MKATVSGKTLELILGDITDQTTDAIANAANSRLAGGGGVDGAIHRAAGPTLSAECTRIGHCPTGSAVATGGGDLRARYVFHAVGPIWQGGGRGEEGLLAAAYRRCLELAEETGSRSLSFPSISTGAYGYPVERAAATALGQVVEHLEKPGKLAHVVFVLYDEASLSAFQKALTEVCSRRKTVDIVPG